MTKARAGLVAGLATATCMIPAAAWASPVVVIRCEAQAEGYISVTHWTYSSDAYVDLGDGLECAESISRLLEAGFRLPFAPTTTVSGPNRERISFSFVFFAGSGSQIGSSGNPKDVLPAIGEHPLSPTVGNTAPCGPTGGRQNRLSACRQQPTPPTQSTCSSASMPARPKRSRLHGLSLLPCHGERAPSPLRLAGQPRAWSRGGTRAAGLPPMRRWPLDLRPCNTCADRSRRLYYAGPSHTETLIGTTFNACLTPLRGHFTPPARYFMS